MTIATYTDTRPSATILPLRKPTGTAHAGPAWTASVQALRAALRAALLHTPDRRGSADQVALDLIDGLDQLDSRALHVLQVTMTILLRAASHPSN